MAKQTIGAVHLDVILRTKGDDPTEYAVGEITVPVVLDALGAPHVDPESVERALGSFGDEHRPTARTRRGRRKQKGARP